MCVLFQLVKALILPFLSSANISKYIFTLIRITGQASKVHMEHKSSLSKRVLWDLTLAIFICFWRIFLICWENTWQFTRWSEAYGKEHWDHQDSWAASEKGSGNLYAKRIQNLAQGNLGILDQVAKGILGFQAVEFLSAFQRPTQWTSRKDTRQKPNTKARLFQNPAYFWLGLHWNQQVSGKCDDFGNLVFSTSLENQHL